MLQSSTVVNRFTAAWGPLLNKEACELKCLPDLDVLPSICLLSINMFKSISYRDNTNQNVEMRSSCMMSDFKLLHCKQFKVLILTYSIQTQIYNMFLLPVVICGVLTTYTRH